MNTYKTVSEKLLKGHGGSFSLKSSPEKITFEDKTMTTAQLKAALLAGEYDERLTALVCPHCGEALGGLRWVNQGDQRYMNLFTCPEHGPMLVRARFRRDPDSGLWAVNKLVYEADDGMQEYYKNKSAQTRRRGRGHSARKNRPASK